MLKLRPTGLGQPDDYEVFDENRKPVGRIMWSHAALIKGCNKHFYRIRQFGARWALYTPFTSQPENPLG